MIDGVAARKEQIRATYDRVAPNYDMAGPGCFAHFGRRLVEIAGIAPGQRVLDVATGRGAVLFPATERVGPGGEVSGIDLAEGMVRLAKDEATRRGVAAPIRVMDAEQLDFPDATFDQVLCGFGIMFFPNLDRALSEFRRVLKPGGQIGVSTWRVSPRDDLAVVLTRLGLRQEAVDVALQFKDPEDLERSLVEAGLADVRVLIDETTFRFADIDEYWQNAYGTGMSRWINPLDEAQRASVKIVLTEHLHPFQRTDGLYVPACALLATATR